MASIASGLIGFVNAGRAAKNLADQNQNAEQGVIQAQRSADTNVNAAGNAAIQSVNSGVQTGQAAVNQATGNANQTLGNVFAGESNNLDPYLQAGQVGLHGLQSLATSGPNGGPPQFSFDPSQVANDPAYQFQMQQGLQALQNSAAARGLLSSGNTLQDITKFSQGNAATYENQDFNQALQKFNTNFQTAQQSYLPLANFGQNANQMYNSAAQNYGNQVANNLNNAGYFAGQTDVGAGQYAGDTYNNMAKFLASLNNQSAVQAGNFAVGVGQAQAGGKLAQGQALSNIAGAIPGFFSGASIFG